MANCCVCKRIVVPFKSFREGEVCRGCWLAAQSRVVVNVMPDGRVFHEVLKVSVPESIVRKAAVA